MTAQQDREAYTAWRRDLLREQFTPCPEYRRPDHRAPVAFLLDLMAEQDSPQEQQA